MASEGSLGAYLIDYLEATLEAGRLRVERIRQGKARRVLEERFTEAELFDLGIHREVRPRDAWEVKVSSEVRIVKEPDPLDLSRIVRGGQGRLEDEPPVHSMLRLTTLRERCSFEVQRDPELTPQQRKTRRLKKALRSGKKIRNERIARGACPRCGKLATHGKLCMKHHTEMIVKGQNQRAKARLLKEAKNA